MNGRDGTGVGAGEFEVNDGLLCVGAMLALFACATGSLMLTLYAGRHNHSVGLVVMFVLWVESPFAGLYVANAYARRRPVRQRTALHIATLIISISAAVIYGVVALFPPQHGMAFYFLVTPAVSWVVIGVDTAIALR